VSREEGDVPPARPSARPPVPRLKAAIWIAGLAPLAWVVAAGLRDDLTADPVKYLTHVTGKTTLAILALTLAVSPLRRLTGVGQLARVRRLVGLFAFFYATIHLLIYFVFDRGLVLAELGEDIAKRPYITVGFTAWGILLVLAATSPLAMVRRLGGKRWQALHRLVYLAAPLGLLHFAWAQKKDLLPMAPFVAAFAAVVALRLASRPSARPPV
jgi:sulfoxide reductase heme-binding subunit YedZ